MISDNIVASNMIDLRNALPSTEVNLTPNYSTPISHYIILPQ